MGPPIDVMGVCSPKNYYYADKTVPCVINVMPFVFIVFAVVLSAVVIFRGALKRKVATDGGARSSPPFFRTPQQHANLHRTARCAIEDDEADDEASSNLTNSKCTRKYTSLYRARYSRTLIIATSDASSSLLAHLVPRKFLCCRIVLIYHEPLLPKIIYSMKVVPQQHNSNEV